MKEEYAPRAKLQDEVDRLARRFKVSTLVILRRMHDAGGLDSERFRAEYVREVARLQALPKGSGGNFHLTLATRTSKRFARALLVSTLEGQTLHRDAFRLLGISKHATFEEFARSLEVG